MIASAADREKSRNPDLGAGIRPDVGKSAREGREAGEKGNRDFNEQHERRANAPLPKAKDGRGPA